MQGACAAFGIPGRPPLCGKGLRRFGDTGSLGTQMPVLLWKHRGLRRFGERVSAALGKLGRALLWGRALSHFGAWAFTALATPGPLLLWGHWGLRCFGNTMASALCGRALRPLGTPGLRRFRARASSTLAARGLRHFVAGPFAALGHGPQCFGDLGASTDLGQGPPPL